LLGRLLRHLLGVRFAESKLIPVSLDPPSIIPEDPTEPFLQVQAGVLWFDRFRLVRVLGQGGMGVVWAAHDERLETSVALKFLPGPIRWDEAGMSAIRGEVNRARQLSHPHIVRIHDLYENNEGVAIAMELVEGWTLGAWRLEQPNGLADPEAILPWLGQLCEALDYAHQNAGIVHRDIKPGNLLISRDGNLKITDFGVAAQMSETMARVSSVSSSGTLVYMSPQQLWGEPPAVTDDIYALGATLYELMGGEPPFVRGDIVSQVERKRPMLLSARLRASRVERTIPTIWEEVVMQCLDKKPECRPQSLSAVMNGLSGMGSGVLRDWRSKRGFRLVAGVIVLGLVLFGVFIMKSRIGAEVGLGGGVDESQSPQMASLSAKSEERADVDTVDPVGQEDSREVFGSMAVDLICHLPLNGVLVNMVGFLSNVKGSREQWTEDRFGRKDAAALLNSHSLITAPIPETFVRNGVCRIALSMWLRRPEGGGQILELIPDVARAMSVGLAVYRGRLIAVFGENEDSRKKELSAGLDGNMGEWIHIALLVDGEEATLWVNGENRGALSLDEGRELPIAHRYSLRIGHDQSAMTSSNEFAIDDVRVWRRLLDDDVVRSLSMEDDPPLEKVVHEEVFTLPWERETVFRLAEGRYHADDDLAAAVIGEFGSASKVADWNDIKFAVGPWPSLWAELSGFFEGNTQVLRGGSRAFSDRRNYNMARLNGIIPRFYLAHAQVGNQELGLGSWTSSPPMMAEIPTGDRYHVVRHSGAKMAEETVGLDLEGVGEGDFARYKYASGKEPSGDIVRRIWMFELPPEISRWKALSLEIGDGMELSLEQQERRRWDMVIRESVDSIPVVRTIIMAAKTNWWVIVQSEGRLYQMLAEGTDKLVLQELVINGLVDDASLEAPWRINFTNRVGSSSFGGIPTAQFPSLIQVDESKNSWRILDK